VLPGLEEVLRRALAKDPDERYETCAEFITALREALGVAEPRPKRWSLVVTAIAALGLALVALGFVVLRSGAGDPASLPPAGDGAIVRIYPASGETLSTVPFGQDLSGIAFGSGSVWVASLGSGVLARIDPESARLEETISVAGARRGPSGIAVSGSLVWIVNGGDDKIRLYRADEREFSTVEPRLAAGAGCACPDQELPAVAGSEWLWTVGRAQDTLARFAAEDSTANTTPLRAGSDPTDLAIDANVIWAVTSVSAPMLFKIDPTTNRVIGRMKLPATAIPSGVAVGVGAVWVANLLDDTVLRIEGRLQSDSSLSQWETLEVVARIPVGQGPSDIAVGEGAVWVANYLDGTVSRIDPATNAVAEAFPVGRWPDHVAVGEGSVWVTLDPPEEG
jgi:YVTN family beta-propeller protein